MQAIYDIAEICFRLQLKEIIISPGSRSAPLTLAFVRHPGFSPRVVSDERSAGFIALGLAQNTHVATVLVCTSGSAAYNLAPAISEAFYQQVPLLVLTADRPTEWIGQLDGQTIKQQNIYQGHVKGSFNLPLDDGHPDTRWYIYRVLSEAIQMASDFPNGPVHINIPLREPLYPTSEIIYSSDIKIIRHQDGVLNFSDKTYKDLQKALSAAKRILIVPGQQPPDHRLLIAVQKFAECYGAVVLADVVSNFHPMDASLLMHDNILLAEPRYSQLEPDLLITFGKSVVSKNLKKFLRNVSSMDHWHLQPAGYVADTFQHLNLHLAIEPCNFFDQLETLGKPQESTPHYQKTWREQELNCKTALDSFFANSESFSEFGVLFRLMTNLPENILLHLSNSMPVRYAGALGLIKKKNIEVFANRGTSGIDGVLSTAVGAALSTEKLVVVVIGDMAFFYDRNAYWNLYLPSNLRVILLNNHGGGIFRMIDGSAQQPEMKSFFETDQPLSARLLADEYNIKYSSCASYADLDVAWDGFFDVSTRSQIMEIETDPEVNKSVYIHFKKQMTEL